MPTSGTAMRTVSPANTRAVRSLGRGGSFVDASDSWTRIVTVAAVSLPVSSTTANVARAVSGRFGAWYRSTSPETNISPSPAASPSTRSGRSSTRPPSGSYAESSTGIVTTPPVRTLASTFGTTGGWDDDDGGTGCTTI